jgi:hypothetical protein
MEHKIKEQTKKHVKQMKKHLASVMELGFTEDDVIDLGDYILDKMTIQELTGAPDEKPKKDKKATKGADSPKPEAKEEELESPEEEAEEPTKKPKKDKKAKAKKAK